MTKKELGLTNSEVAELIKELSDDDFYEVMMLVYEGYEKTGLTLGQNIDAWLNEIKENIEESED